MSSIWLLMLGSFFVGTISFAALISRFKGVNLREVGSKNLGATNVYRAMGLPYAILVFSLDLFKGYLPTFLALDKLEQPHFHILIGFLAILGHSFSPWVRFKGGKGAATGLGVLLALCPDVFAVVFVLALVLILITRYVGPVTVLCSILIPILMYFFDYPTAYIYPMIAVALFVVFRHKDNIKRFLKGQENKV